MSLTEAFWEDSTPHQRRLFLDEANGRRFGRITFEFDCFDVMLDFDESTATVIDVLGSDELETTTLGDFLARAASFGDDRSMGDGLTELQRRPAQYLVDTEGTIEPAGGDTTG